MNLKKEDKIQNITKNVIPISDTIIVWESKLKKLIFKYSYKISIYIPENKNLSLPIRSSELWLFILYLLSPGSKIHNK